MTATAVLDRTNIAARAAAPSPSPHSGDEEYARQLNRRLTDDRSSAPRTANTPRADTAPSRTNENRAGVEPTSQSEADPPAVGLTQNPFVANANAAGEVVVPAEEPGDSLNVQGVSIETPADSAVSSAPPFPWQQNATAIVEPQRPADVPKEFPPTAKAPASPHPVHRENADDASIPQGLVRANEVTTTRSRGVIAPPGLVVAFDAVQQRPANPPANPTVIDASSEASVDSPKSPQPVTPTAPSAVTTIASAPPTRELVPAVPIVDVEQPADSEGNSSGDPAASATGFQSKTNNMTHQVSAETASVEAASAAQKPVNAVPVATTAPATTSIEPAEATTVEATPQIGAADLASISSNSESTNRPVADQPQQVANQHRNSNDSAAHAADVVADATKRAVEAVASSPAAPAAGGRAASSSQAIPTALHASLIERAIEVADVSNPPATDSAGNVAADTGVSSVRNAAKPPATLAGETIRTPQLSETDLAEGLPRHAAAALRAAAGLDRPIRIRLSPAELGALQVEVGRHEGTLHARFEVTTPAAQTMLHDHLSAMRESLGRAGLTIDRIDVRLVESSPDEGRADSQQQSNAGGEQGGYSGQEHERPRSEHRDASGRELELDGTSPSSGDSVASQVERPKRNALNHAADFLDIQV